MDIGFLVDAEVAGLTTFDAAYIKLEHSGELRPQCLAYTVVIEVKHWDFVAIAHHALELLINLDAQQHCVDIKASAGTCA